MLPHDHRRTSTSGAPISVSKGTGNGPARKAAIIIDCAGDLAADDTLPPSLRVAAAQTLLDDLARALARVIIDMHAKGQTADQEPPP